MTKYVKCYNKLNFRGTSIYHWCVCLHMCLFLCANADAQTMHRHETMACLEFYDHLHRFTNVNDSSVLKMLVQDKIPLYYLQFSILNCIATFELIAKFHDVFFSSLIISISIFLSTLQKKN